MKLFGYTLISNSELEKLKHDAYCYNSVSLEHNKDSNIVRILNENFQALELKLSNVLNSVQNKVPAVQQYVQQRTQQNNSMDTYKALSSLLESMCEEEMQKLKSLTDTSDTALSEKVHLKIAYLQEIREKVYNAFVNWSSR